MSQDVLSHYYKFHGIFRVTVQSNSAKARSHFQAEYGLFETFGPRNPDLQVTVGRFAVGTQPDAGTNQAPNSDRWIFIRERHKVASWQFAMKGLDAPTTELLFDGGIFSLDYLQHYIEQIMRFKISRHGYALVHAGCVASDGSAILFPGLGHAGKTALALHQVLAGRKFQA